MEAHATDLPQSDHPKSKDEQPVQSRHSSRSRSRSSSRSSRSSIDVVRDKRNRPTRSGRNRSKSRSVSRSSSQSRDRHEPVSKRVRRRSRSREHERRHSPSTRDRPRGREASPPPVRVEIKNEPTEPKETLQKLSQRVVKTSGVYIPLPKLRAMQASIKDKSGEEYQRMAWETLKKSIHGLVNKVSKTNLPVIVRQLFGINIIRSRGVFIQSLMKAQSASRTFTNVYAALVAIVNSKLPQLGELLLRRLIVSFRRAYQRNVKSTCIASVEFIAHLVNQRVVHELLALELLMLLLSPSTLTADSVEIAVDFVKQCGQRLTELSPRGVHGVFERLRDILHAQSVEARVQYMIEVLFQVRKDSFSDHPAVLEQLDLVPEDEQFTHTLRLSDELSADDQLDVFKLDPNFEENESKFLSMKAEILGEGDGDAVTEGDESGAESDAASEEGEGAGGAKPAGGAEAGGVIVDETATNLVSLRRTIYLTIQSALDFEEAAHKLLKMQLKPGQEAEVCYMILDCCAQLRTYEKFFGLLAQRFCALDKKYAEPIANMFAEQYSTCHRLETMKLRNVAKFFAHLLHTDAIPWSVLQCIKLNETDSTSSSRIFIKILFQELAEYIGLVALNQRLQDPTMQNYFAGIFPRDNPKNTRFAINFFTCIGLGGLTDELREFLKSGGAAAKPEPPAIVGPTLQPAAALPPVKQEPPESTTRASNLAMKREPSETRSADSETREKKQRLLEHLHQLVDESDSESPDENQTRDRHKSSKQHREQSCKKADREHKPSKKASDDREVRAHESKRQKPTEKSHEKASRSAHSEHEEKEKEKKQEKEKSGHRPKKLRADAQNEKEKEKTTKSKQSHESGRPSARKRSHSPDAPRRFRSSSSSFSDSASASSSGSSSASSSEDEQTPPQKQKQKRTSKSHAEPSKPARHESRPVANASSRHAKKHSRSKSPASPNVTRDSARKHKR